jgi:hypothetical protein
MDEKPLEEDEADDSPQDGNEVNDRLFGDNDSREAWEWALEEDEDLSELTLEG